METTIAYWGHIGIMENEMESTITGYRFGQCSGSGCV